MLRAESPAACTAQARYTIAVHGGYVGEAHPDWPNAAVKELTRQIVARGRERLAEGASALDVVVDSIVAFEDSGQVDAGKGSFENSAGFVETDASLMVGSTGHSGAVAAMQRLKNPILAARLVMDKTPHVLFVGAAGEQTLIGLGAAGDRRSQELLQAGDRAADDEEPEPRDRRRRGDGSLRCAGGRHLHRRDLRQNAGAGRRLAHRRREHLRQRASGAVHDGRRRTTSSNAAPRATLPPAWRTSMCRCRAPPTPSSRT